MNDNTKKIMLVSTVLGSLVAVTFGYKYYYEPKITKIEDKMNKTLNTKLKNLPNEEEKTTTTITTGGFLNSLTKTIGFGGDFIYHKNPDKKATKKQVTLELNGKKQEKKQEKSEWPTFN